MGTTIFIFGGNNTFLQPEQPKLYVVYRQGSAGKEYLKNGRFGKHPGDKYSLEDAQKLAKQLNAEYE